MPHDLVHSFVLHGTDGDNGYAEHFFHLVDVYCSAIVSHFVHHVEGKDDGDIEFHQLYGQIEIALYVCCIDDVDDAAGIVFQYEAAAYHLFARVGAEAVDAGEVDDGCFGEAFYVAVFALDCHTGEVANVLSAAC